MSFGKICPINERLWLILYFFKFNNFIFAKIDNNRFFPTKPFLKDEFPSYQVDEILKG